MVTLCPDDVMVATGSLWHGEEVRFLRGALRPRVVQRTSTAMGIALYGPCDDRDCQHGRSGADAGSNPAPGQL